MSFFLSLSAPLHGTRNVESLELAGVVLEEWPQATQAHLTATEKRNTMLQRYCPTNFRGWRERSSQHERCEIDTHMSRRRAPDTEKGKACFGGTADEDLTRAQVHTAGPFETLVTAIALQKERFCSSPHGTQIRPP